MGPQRRNSARFVCEQPQYSIFARSAEVAVLPACQRHGIAVIPWSPLAGGWLTDKYRRGEDAPPGSRLAYGVFSRRSRPLSQDRHAPARFDALEALEEIAQRAGLSLTHLALGFVSAHPGITSAIIGPKTQEQLEDLLPAADIVLDEATLDAIDAVVRPGTDIAGIQHHTGDPSLTPALRRRPAITSA